MRILVIEDNPAAREAIDVYLGRHGYQVVTAATGAAALAALDAAPHDLAILDLALPDMDGLALCRTLRARAGQLPILILTGRAGVEDELAGFAAAADDYLRKPAALPVLLARVRALARRAKFSGTADLVRLTGGVEIDLRAREVRRDGRAVRIGPRTFELLLWFVEHPGRVWSKPQLVDYVWGGERAPVHSTVEWHVSRIREALGDTGKVPRYLVTRPMHGYVMRADAVESGLPATRAARPEVLPG